MTAPVYLRIREEERSDIPAIRELVTAAFGRAVEADLVDRLRADGDAVISLVATEGGGLVGHLLLSRMMAPVRALGLAPVSVLPARQGVAIGSKLIGAGVARAAQAGWEAVFVLGDPAFYSRFGFDAELARGFQSQYAGSCFMVMAVSGSLSATSGRVEYAPAFAGLS
jgi:putative acetyltransferase